MAFDSEEKAKIIKALEDFLEKRRPPEEMRDELDLAYRIVGQSVIIYDIRPNWQNKTEKIEEPIAKTTWVGTQEIWKVFWMRADLKWHGYDPKPKVKTIKAFLKLVDEDKYGCFWG